MEARCVFFNYFELEKIRRSINENLVNFFNSKVKNIVFATSAKVYAYHNQIVSVRIILAKFSKIPEEDIDDVEELKDYKESLKKDDLSEEEDSDEDTPLDNQMVEILDNTPQVVVEKVEPIEVIKATTVKVEFNTEKPK